ncbi:hypothetical protein [Borreliella japonica]|uniref:hypothetical protein n=1 Tax=Borreliella japonica TaxID=34095 RepID=UPI003AEF2A22
MNKKMNKKMRIFIICAVFALIISCNNYTSGEDLKQNVKEQVKGIKQGIEIERKIKQGIEEQVKGFLEKKEGIISDDEIAKKLKEEELKEKKENKQEKKKEEEKVEREEKQETKEELIQGDDPNNINQAQILQANSQDSKLELEAVQQSESGGQQKEEEKKEEQAKAKAEQERKIKEERQRQEEKQVKSKIKTLTKKIDEINKNIDSIKHQSWFVEDVKRVIVGAQEVIDKVTGPIYDHFTDDNNNAIYYTWNLDGGEDSELEELLKKLSKTRSDLRTKLNVGNQAATWNNTPPLKENVKVVEIESDLDSLKSELERVKTYLTNESNFETIKEYIFSSDDE